MFEAFMKLFCDYEIVGDYYDKISEGVYQKKYIKKWRFKWRKKK